RGRLVGAAASEVAPRGARVVDRGNVAAGGATRTFEGRGAPSLEAAPRGRTADRTESQSAPRTESWRSRPLDGPARRRDTPSPGDPQGRAVDASAGRVAVAPRSGAAIP